MECFICLDTNDNKIIILSKVFDCKCKEKCHKICLETLDKCPCCRKEIDRSKIKNKWVRRILFFLCIPLCCLIIMVYSSVIEKLKLSAMTGSILLGIIYLFSIFIIIQLDIRYHILRN